MNVRKSKLGAERKVHRSGLEEKGVSVISSKLVDKA